MGEVDSERTSAGLEWLPFARPIMFRRPNYLQASAWLEHLPFAMWIIDAHRPATVVELGTHNGPSYFGFCQAVAELGLDTACYAVDTWQGDEHAGYYGQEVYERVHIHNDAHYSGFSRLVRSTFDDAASHFSDGSIDLLHIDGLHTLDAVAHDFETWKPKLSRRAVVMFHDINVRERGFGVFKLFEQLREQHPAFWFVHGHGLGVLGVGADQGEAMQRLFALSDADASALTSVREIFARLGRACADAYESRSARIPESVAVVDLHKQRALDVAAIAAAERGRLLERLEDARAEIAEKDRGAVELSDRIARQQREHQQMLESQRQAHQAEADESAKAHRHQLRQRFEEIAALSRRIFDVEQQLFQKTADWNRREVHLQRIEGDIGLRVLNRIRPLVFRAPLVVRVDPRQEDIDVIQASDSVDADWYRNTYPDVASADIDPVEHYVLFGAAEGRDPSPSFSTSGYMARYADVYESGINPLAHFLMHGRAEGRSTEPPPGAA